jgi:hypothetical protein
MKKVKIEGHHKGFYFYEWRFTEDEKHEIRRILRNKQSEGNIKDFIRHVEFFCDGKKDLDEHPSLKTTRATRERVLMDCKAALEHLKQLDRGEKITWNMGTLDAYGAGSAVKDPVADAIIEAHDDAWEAFGPLERFVKNFEKYHLSDIKKIGRKKADSDHFIRKIRDAYLEHIGKPTAYEKGAFFSVVQVILEIMDLPCADPSKAIKAALKNQ